MASGAIFSSWLIGGVGRVILEICRAYCWLCAPGSQLVVLGIEPRLACMLDKCLDCCTWPPANILSVIFKTLGKLGPGR